jgi:hypothetical protein
LRIEPRADVRGPDSVGGMKRSGAREAETARRASVVRWALTWLAHPVSLVAIGVLVVNDHLLKAQFGSWWTGKLSDVAGMVFFPALVATVLAAVAPRLTKRHLVALAVAITAVGFAWVKTADAGAATASAVLTGVAGPSVVLKDATDLLTLPALGLAVYVGLRVSGDAREAVRKAALTVALPVALLASVATSKGEGYEYYETYDPYEFTGMVAFENKIYADFSYAHEQDDEWAMLVRGYAVPHTWSTITVYWSGGTPYSGTLAAHANETERGAVAACVEPDLRVCYRALGTGIGVDVSTDGGATWTPEWRLDPADEAVLEARWLDHWHLSEAPGAFVTTAVAVLPVAGGYQVWAANGLDGLSYRDVDGGWVRVGDPLQGVVPLASDSRGTAG